MTSKTLEEKIKELAEAQEQMTLEAMKRDMLKKLLMPEVKSCPVCGGEMSTDYELKMHMDSHARDEAIKEMLEKSKAKEPEPEPDEDLISLLEASFGGNYDD